MDFVHDMHPKSNPAFIGWDHARHRKIDSANVFYYTHNLIKVKEDITNNCVRLTEHWGTYLPAVNVKFQSIKPSSRACPGCSWTQRWQAGQIAIQVFSFR